MILFKGYNYFTSIPLLEHLKNVGVCACGTIKANRKFLPTYLKQDKTMQRGYFDYRVANDIVFYKWMDNKPVTVVSDFHGTDTAKVSRRLRDGSRKKFDCPLAVKEYNMCMGGVNLAELRCAANGRSPKSLKWWQHIFFWLLDRTLANSFVVFKQLTHENVTMLIYQRHAVQSLITLAKPPKLGCPVSNTTSSDSQSVPKKRKSNYSVNKSVCLENLECHWVIYVSERGRCEVCSQNKVKSRSHSKCSTCGVFYAAMRKKIASLSIMKFSRLSFKDTMMLGVLNFVEYL